MEGGELAGPQINRITITWQLVSNANSVSSLQTYLVRDSEERGPANCNAVSLLGDSDACPYLRSTARLEKHLRLCGSPLEFLVPRPMSIRVEVNYDGKYQGPKANWSSGH